MNNILFGKKVLVTGASSGIGRATAQVFSKQGAVVVGVGRSSERLQSTLESLEGKGHQIIECDLDAASSIEELFKVVSESVGELDAVIHCAGIQKTLPLQAIKESDFDDVFSTNVKSAQFIAKSFRKRGRHKQEGSSLVLMSSVASVCGEPGISTYSASKAALIGLTKSLAAELARNKIRVNCISPGVVKTDMAEKLFSQLTEEQYHRIEGKHMIGLGKPDDVANSALYLASDLSRWVTGTNLFVDGGYSAQ